MCIYIYSYAYIYTLFIHICISVYVYKHCHSAVCLRRTLGALKSMPGALEDPTAQGGFNLVGFFNDWDAWP